MIDKVISALSSLITQNIQYSNVVYEFIKQEDGQIAELYLNSIRAENKIVYYNILQKILNHAKRTKNLTAGNSRCKDNTTSPMATK